MTPEIEAILAKCGKKPKISKYIGNAYNYRLDQVIWKSRCIDLLAAELEAKNKVIHGIEGNLEKLGDELEKERAIIMDAVEERFNKRYYHVFSEYEAKQFRDAVIQQIDRGKS